MTTALKSFISSDADLSTLLASIVESSDDAIISKDLNGIVSSWNKAAERIFGYTAEEAIGRHITFLIPAERHPEESGIIDAIRRGEHIDHYETVRRRKDGTEIDVSLTVSPIRNASGHVVGASKIARDVTEQKRALEIVRKADKELRDFVENANVGMHWVGPDGIIIWANRSELEMLGYSADEYIGHHIADFHADRPVIEDILRRLTERETLVNYGARLLCKDGSTRDVTINSSVYWEGDKFIHTRCFTRDVSERRAFEQRIQLLGREAEHRAKNVLATVQAIVHLTQADSADAVKKAIAGRIRALANVHALFANPQSGGAELRALVEQELLPYYKGNSKPFETHGPKVLLKSDIAQTMAVALHELATNAAKYGALSTTTGCVRVEWSFVADEVLLLRWTETCGPPVQPPTRTGFGTRVIENMIGQIGGMMRSHWRPDGLACEIVLTGVGG
ncbi:MAG: PAS domain S-box protein [Xanthobacteraceae bacterium]|nr:PAS domain S-box protein [Xanthobacteraceae bacterium]